MFPLLRNSGNSTANKVWHNDTLLQPFSQQNFFSSHPLFLWSHKVNLWAVATLKQLFVPWETGWSLGLKKPGSHSSKQFWQLLKTCISKYSKLNLAQHQRLPSRAALTKLFSAHQGSGTCSLTLEMLLAELLCGSASTKFKISVFLSHKCRRT